MSPLTFVRRPSLWIEIMSRYQATHIQVWMLEPHCPWRILGSGI